MKRASANFSGNAWRQDSSRGWLIVLKLWREPPDKPGLWRNLNLRVDNEWIMEESAARTMMKTGGGCN
jgi:hypothetical protein